MFSFLWTSFDALWRWEVVPQYMMVGSDDSRRNQGKVGICGCHHPLYVFIYMPLIRIQYEEVDVLCTLRLHLQYPMSARDRMQTDLGYTMLHAIHGCCSAPKKTGFQTIFRQSSKCSLSDELYLPVEQCRGHDHQAWGSAQPAE